MGRWYSGQHKRVVSGIDGILLIVVMGDGKLIVPVDFAVRQPDPHGPGARSYTKLQWAQVMLDQGLAAFAKRGLRLPMPLAVADSWFSDSKFMGHVRETHQGILLVQGKSSMPLRSPMAARSKVVTYSGTTRGPGVSVSMRQAVAMPDCGLTAPPMVK